MTNLRDRFRYGGVGNTLAGGFFLVILLGLAGYYQTVRAMEASTRRSQGMERRVSGCVLLARDVTLWSHDTAADTQRYVYTGDTANRDQKWETEQAADNGFQRLQAQLAALPDSADLQRRCAAAAQNLHVCEPLEAQAIMQEERGRHPQAAAVIEGPGKSARYRLEIQLDDLVGVDRQQGTITGAFGLVAYGLKAQKAEAIAASRTLALGKAVQAAIITLSLLIAIGVTRSAARGVRAVLRAQGDLGESEARYRLLFERNPHPMFVYDRYSLRYMAVNDAAIRRYGYSHDEFSRMSILDVRPPEDRDALRRAIETLGPGNPKTDHHWRHVTKDGGLLWVDINSQPIIWDGREAGIVIAQDVTSRREAEAGLNRLAAIVQSSQDAIVGWDVDGTVTSWNPGAERLYGWTAGEMLGHPITDLIPPERADEIPTIREKLLAGQAVELPDTLRLHRDGHRLDVSVSTSVIKDAAGEAVGASTISRDISERKKTEALIRWQAHNDSLTRLPNRTRFGEEMETAITQGVSFAVLYIDLDRFKRVNDSLGHLAGDQLVQEVAARFGRCLGPDDLLARMGGDEFTLLLRGMADSGMADGAHEVARRLLDQLDRPVVPEGQNLHVSASVGVSVFPDDGADSETLLKHADLAMYRAKEEGRGRWKAFTPALTDAARERLTLENSLRLALERGEMTLFYQPQVSLESGVVLGAEALVRWRHPEWGMVSPGRFIPLAEETGLILPLGEWVLREACRQAGVWAREGRPLRVSVNLSARQLTEAGLVGDVRDALDAARLDPRWLDLELTESALIGGGTAVEARLVELRALGIRISVDDFGTGYSSLSYLRRLPLDVLKVDRSFVMGMAGEGGDHPARDQAIVRAVIDMAHALSLEVIAEGVEDEAQRGILARLGCDMMQGFLFSPPVPVEGLEALLFPREEGNREEEQSGSRAALERAA
jgi:diguanylate cyclase (GGDEF)-like protein/PAS domain S-box-containing protein